MDKTVLVVFDVPIQYKEISVEHLQVDNNKCIMRKNDWLACKDTLQPHYIKEIEIEV